MSTYGIEIFNADGLLVYSSELYTPRVIEAGKVELMMPNGSQRTLTFAPTTIQPQLFMGIGYAGVSRTVDTRYIPPTDFFPFPQYEYAVNEYLTRIGPFLKNDNGEYYGFTIVGQNIRSYTTSELFPMPPALPIMIPMFDMRWVVMI